MRVFKNQRFQRFARKEKIPDQELCSAVRCAEDKLIDANLGGNVIKQRIARKGHGKSGGYRSIVLFRRAERAFFVFGFAKNKKDNIDKDEEKAFKALAKVILALDNDKLAKVLKAEKFKEVICDE